MIDLSNTELRDYIEVSPDKKIKIHTDFRYWLKYYKFYSTGKYTGDKLLFLFVDDFPTDLEEWEKAIEECEKFFLNPNLVPKSDSSDTSAERLIDFIEDGEFIYAAYLQTYNIDLTVENLHWHKFFALFRSLPTNTKLSEIMNLRGYKKTTVKQDTMMERGKRAWSLPNNSKKVDDERIKDINAMFWGC